MNTKAFRLIKLSLISLLAIAILNDLCAYLYVAFVWHDSSDFISQVLEILAFALAAYLAYKDNPGADFISCFLALVSLCTIYMAVPHFYSLYSLAWLKTGPQVLFRNISMTALLVVAIIHFTLLLTLKAKKRSAA